MSTKKPGYWDPAGDYEPHDTIYTLTVFVPQRPVPKYVPSFLTREPPDAKTSHTIRPNSSMPDYTCVRQGDLHGMRREVIKVKAYQFPVEFRCKHVENQKSCYEGCYFLEKGGKAVRQFRCDKRDCEGHVYSDSVKEVERRRCTSGDCVGHVYCDHVEEVGIIKCFGKKGTRMVCIEKLPHKGPGGGA
ncbi:hypothetical protein PMIN01_11766 [Paraphaeosphaeria minitans]|uniref:Uncharacterized protein n=1 Tax=Paraphaeosphaeria minitans TaxID=565426 RepID=A0A9P6KJW4_9PLEO|nr:hypothetical protein PMIN01_11766 [Paraphaeosphaeria minitans]